MASFAWPCLTFKRNTGQEDVQTFDPRQGAMPAIVGACLLRLHLPVSQSLKDKRQVLRSLQGRLREQFRVSVAETGGQDKWQSAEVLVAFAASDTQRAQELLSRVVDFVEGSHLAVELVDAETELLYYDEE